MNLRIARSAGFCFGVKRAMDLALAATQKYPGDLYTLGPLIHNPQAVEFLEGLGIQGVEEIEAIPRGTVIFRSHGVSSQDLAKAKGKRLRIIDATCPIVKRAQYYAKFLHRSRYTVLIVGDAHHPEVEAIRSYLPDRVDVIEQAQEIEQKGPWGKLGIIAQTTQSFLLFKEVVALSLGKAKEVRAFNTICHATTIRQKEAVEIAKKVDCMIVVGGHNSGNTQRLASICREIQPRTVHIESVQELNSRKLAPTQRIGLTAGASTPHWIIQEIKEAIQSQIQRKK